MAQNREYATTVSATQRHIVGGSGSHVEQYKNTLVSATREVLGPRLRSKKPWISQATLAIIDQHRKAMQIIIDEYKRLAGPRRRSLRHDKQLRMEQVASTGENHLLCGEIKDAFASFRHSEVCNLISSTEGPQWKAVI